MYHDEFTNRDDLSPWQKFARRHPEKANPKRIRSKRTPKQLKAHRESERERKRKFREQHPLQPYYTTEEKAKHIRENNLRYYRKLRHDAIMAYGGYKCACPGCNHTEPEFLGIDHIAGGGSKHRKEIGHHNFYWWLKHNNYPQGFRVLCHNCNLAKGLYGFCPHEKSIALSMTATA
jgi:hypothetical protein